MPKLIYFTSCTSRLKDFYHHLIDKRVGEGAEDDEEENGTGPDQPAKAEQPFQPSYKKIQTFDNPNYGSTTNNINPIPAFGENGIDNGGFVSEKNGLSENGMEINHARIDQTAYEAAVPMQDILGNEFISKSFILSYIW